MSYTDWKSKAIEKTVENKQLKKRIKELTQSRDEWKAKSIAHKARADKSIKDLIKLKKTDRDARYSINNYERPKNHSFSLSIIQLSITLVSAVGVSFRAVNKIFIHLNLYFHLNLDVPTHTTVLNWTKKRGIGQFVSKESYQQQNWVLILDESCQFGNKKLLLILAVPESRCRQPNALSYSDIQPLVLKVSASWKSADISSEIKQHIDIEQIAYCISDAGNNLTCAVNSLKCKHIADVNHKFSLIIQSVFENNILFKDYTKELALLRAQKSMSKMARIVPPNQRVMSRFMNLKPLFEWGIKMIDLIDKNQLTEDEKTTLSFLAAYKDFIFDTYQILTCLYNIQQTLKNKGFSKKTEEEVRQLFSNMKCNNWLKIKQQIDKYFEDLISKAEDKTICCSSDIIESCFSKYKGIVKGNKTVGISDLCLCIACMMGENNPIKTKKAIETVSIKQIKEWKTKNIAKSLFAEKIELNKK